MGSDLTCNLAPARAEPVQRRAAQGSGDLNRYARMTGVNWPTGRHLLRFLRERNCGPVNTVIDIGCGRKPFRRFFPAQAYIGVDFGPEACPDIRADMRRLPIRAECADTVLMFQVLGDVTEPAEVIAEAHRLLAPGGTMVVFETMCYPQHDNPHDYFRIMPAGLAAMAERNGFAAIRLAYLGGLFTRISSLLNNYLFARFMRIPLLNLVSRLCIVLVNVACAGLDEIFDANGLSESYIAEFRKPAPAFPV